MVRTSHTRRFLFAFAISNALSSSLAPPIHAADRPVQRAVPPMDDELRPYRSPFEEASLAMDGGHYDVACPELLRIVRNDRTPEHLFQMAQCHELWGKVATAYVAYGDYLAMVDQLEGEAQKKESKRENAALAHYAALEKRVPWVTLYLPLHAPANTKVTRRSMDGGPPERVPLEKALAIDPGEHVVQTIVPTGRPYLNTLVIREGQRRSVVLEVDLEPNGDAFVEDPITPEPPKIPVLDPPTSKRRIAAVGLGIGGGLALALGVTTGAVAFAQNGTSETNCTTKEKELFCDASTQEVINRGKTLVQISGVALPLGLIAIGTGVALHLTEPTPPRITQTGWQLRMGVSPGNASVEVRASW